MVEDEFGISTESVSAPLESAKQCVQMVMDHITSTERAEKIDTTHQKKLERGIEMDC